MLDYTRLTNAWPSITYQGLSRFTETSDRKTHYNTGLECRTRGVCVECVDCPRQLGSKSQVFPGDGRHRFKEQYQKPTSCARCVTIMHKLWWFCRHKHDGRRVQVTASAKTSSMHISWYATTYFTTRYLYEHQGGMFFASTVLQNEH